MELEPDRTTSAPKSVLRMSGAIALHRSYTDRLNTNKNVNISLPTTNDQITYILGLLI